MNRRKDWNPNESQSAKITLDELHKLKPSGSRHPLNTLRQLMKQQIYAGFIALFVLVILIFIFNNLLFAVVLFPICAYFAYFLFRSFKILQSISQINNQPNENILKKIKAQYLVINKYVRTSETIAVFLYPFSIWAGMILALSIIDDEAPANLFHDPFLVYLTIGAVLVFVPLQYFFTRTMNKKTFGSHLEHLKEMVEKLENEE